MFYFHFSCRKCWNISFHFNFTLIDVLLLLLLFYHYCFNLKQTSHNLCLISDTYICTIYESNWSQTLLVNIMFLWYKYVVYVCMCDIKWMEEENRFKKYENTQQMCCMKTMRANSSSWSSDLLQHLFHH